MWHTALPKHVIHVPFKQECSTKEFKYPVSVKKTIRFSFTGFTHSNVNQMKRPRSSMPSPTNAKRQRLDSSDPSSLTPLPNSKPRDSTDKAMPKSDGEEGKTKDSGNSTQSLISTAFTTLHESCFDLLPTIRGRLLTQISELPGLTDEEDSVISYFSENPVSDGLLYYLECIQFKRLYLV